MKMPLSLATLLLIGATMVGCQSGSKSGKAAPITTEGLNHLRATFTQTDAGARLGSVEAVLESSMYLTVGQIDPADFPVGTAVAIIDSTGKPLTNGEVVRTFESAVHVRYEKSTKRAPKVGDVAVRF